MLRGLMPIFSINASLAGRGSNVASVVIKSFSINPFLRMIFANGIPFARSFNAKSRQYKEKTDKISTLINSIPNTERARYTAS
jgi:hypothetical protein